LPGNAIAGRSLYQKKRSLPPEHELKKRVFPLIGEPAEVIEFFDRFQVNNGFCCRPGTGMGGIVASLSRNPV
jgi:hypothetical protein